MPFKRQAFSESIEKDVVGETRLGDSCFALQRLCLRCANCFEPGINFSVDATYEEGSDASGWISV